MATFFISYSHSDSEFAGRVMEQLKAEQFEAVFRDTDIRIGDDWVRSLNTAMRASDAVVFVSSAQSRESKYCTAELFLALTLRKPIFPIVVDQSKPHSLIPTIQAIFVKEGDNRGAVDALIAELKLSGLTGDLPLETDRPYPGLSSFDREDAAVFYGREHSIRNALELLHGYSPFLCIAGPSGSGKSSVAKAGIVKRLEVSSRPRVLTLDPIEPGSRPWQELATSFSRTATRLGLDWDVVELEQALLDPSEVSQRVRKLLASSTDRPLRACLLIDQFEQLETRSSEEDCNALLKALNTWRLTCRDLLVVITLRSEFLTSFAGRGESGALFQNPLLLSRLDQGQLAEVIERPARRFGLEFEAGLATRMIADAQGVDGLPLLAYALELLYKEYCDSRRTSGMILHDDYEAIERVTGALKRQANKALEKLERVTPRLESGPITEGEILATLLRLVTPGTQGEQATNRPLQLSAFNDRSREILNAFLEERLLSTTISEPERRGHGEAATYVKAAHEALFREWEPLKNAVRLNSRWLLERRKVEIAAKAWRESGKSDDYLWAGTRLAQAKKLLLETPGAKLESTEIAFLHASSDREVADLKRRRDERRRKTLVKILAATIPILIVITAVYVWFDKSQRHRKRASELVAELREQQSPEQIFDVIERLGDEMPWAETALQSDLVSGDPIRAHLAFAVNGRGHESNVWQVFESGESTFDRFLAGLAIVKYDINVGDDDVDTREFAIDLICEADPQYYVLIYTLIEEWGKDPQQRSNVLERLGRIAATGEASGRRSAVSADEPSGMEVLKGRRRAGAAITCVRLGVNDLESVLRVSDDPESLTQFVHGCKSRGLTLSQLWSCFQHAEEKRRRMIDNRRARAQADPELFGIMIAMGEFSLSALSNPARNKLVNRLQELFSEDPSSAIHGSTRWLLETWQVDVQDQPMPYDPEREWYTIQVNPKLVPDKPYGAQCCMPGSDDNDPGEHPSLFLTFVVFPASRYRVGSAVSGEADEVPRQIQLTRSFAVLDREITIEEFEISGLHCPVHEFPGTGLHQEARYGDPKTQPMINTCWYDAVKYCRWLTEQHVQDAQAHQPYAAASEVLKDETENPPDVIGWAKGAPSFWPLRPHLTGFRLPTEAEWEIAARAGTRTEYSFGNDADTLLSYYAQPEGVPKTKPIRTIRARRPNLRGMFDMHGSLREWCHDWYPYEATDPCNQQTLAKDKETTIPAEMLVDPMGPRTGISRIYRSGRSADRSRLRAGGWSYNLGFRIAQTVPPEYRERAQEDAAAIAGENGDTAKASSAF